MSIFESLNLQARMRYVKGQNTRGATKPSWFILHPTDVKALEDALPELKEHQKAWGLKQLTYDGTPILEHDLAKPGYPLVVMEPKVD